MARQCDKDCLLSKWNKACFGRRWPIDFKLHRKLMPWLILILHSSGWQGVYLIDSVGSSLQWKDDLKIVSRIRLNGLFHKAKVHRIEYLGFSSNWFCNGKSRRTLTFGSIPPSCSGNMTGAHMGKYHLIDWLILLIFRFWRLFGALGIFMMAGFLYIVKI